MSPLKERASFYQDVSLLVILGHYGSGKTNLALNLAFKLREMGRKPLVVDLDVVNPYFRTTDYLDLTEGAGIRILGPTFGNSNLDAPSLSPGIDSAIRDATREKPVILDVGGDPDGARALARYAPVIEEKSDKLTIFVVNSRRPDTRSIQANLAMIDALEATASLEIDGLLGNTHLAEFTTLETIEESIPFLRELSQASNLPLLGLTVPEEMDASVLKNEKVLPVKRLVKTVWQ